MISNCYSKAYVEVLECLKLLDEEEYNKIPIEIIEYFDNNKDPNYIFKIQNNKNIMEQKLSIEANSINLYLYMKYFSTKNINNKISKKLIENENQYQEMIKSKYNTNLFKNKKNNKP